MPKLVSTWIHLFGTTTIFVFFHVDKGLRERICFILMS